MTEIVAQYRPEIHCKMINRLNLPQAHGRQAICHQIYIKKTFQSKLTNDIPVMHKKQHVTAK